MLASAREFNGRFAGGAAACLLQSNQVPFGDFGPESLRDIETPTPILRQITELGCREDSESADRLTCPSEGCEINGDDILASTLGDLGARDRLKACTVIQSLAHGTECENDTLVLPTPPVCLAPINDPPPITSPFVPLIVPLSEAVLADDSFVRLFPAGGPDGGVRADVTGVLSVTGGPCPGATCDVGVLVWLDVAPVAFNYSVADVPAGRVELQGTTISAQSNFE